MWDIVAMLNAHRIYVYIGYVVFALVNVVANFGITRGIKTFRAYRQAKRDSASIPAAASSV